MKKRYGIYVTSYMANYFEERLREFGSTIIKRIPIRNQNNEFCYYYIHEMEEGIIDPKYEIEES